MKKVLFNRRPSSKNPRTRRRRNSLVQALRNHQARPQTSTTRLVHVDIGDPSLDRMTVVRYLGAQCRGSRTEVLVEARQHAELQVEQDDLDVLSGKESMKANLFHYRDQKLGKGPLRRFLRSQVGRPWHDVEKALRRAQGGSVYWSERAWEAVEHLVSLNAVMEDGSPRDLQRPWLFDMSLRRDHFFVHPETGTLELIPRQPRAKRADGPKFGLSEPSA